MHQNDQVRSTRNYLKFTNNDLNSNSNCLKSTQVDPNRQLIDLKFTKIDLKLNRTTWNWQNIVQNWIWNQHTVIIGISAPPPPPMWHSLSRKIKIYVQKCITMIIFHNPIITLTFYALFVTYILQQFNQIMRSNMSTEWGGGAYPNNYGKLLRKRTKLTWKWQ